MGSANKTPAELRNMFGTNLRQLAKDYVSVSDLSRQLGINRTQFNRYLNGESFPRPDVLSRICDFFAVDARILLEPLEEIEKQLTHQSSLSIRDFLEAADQPLEEHDFPSGFYQFSRRSFVRETSFVRGVVLIKREGRNTVLRGYEPRTVMAVQGIPATAKAREFRGELMRIEDGVGGMVSRLHGMSASFNYLNPVTSVQNKYWIGYVARTMRETTGSKRISRLVYEHLDDHTAEILRIARQAGFCSFEDLNPFHQRLLQPDEPFR